MSDNPYSPPSARVADFEAPGSLERPLVVTRAVYLLWASFALAVPTIIYEGLQPDSELSQGVSLVITLFALGVGAAFAIWLNTAAWRGRGYARWVTAVLTVAGLGFLYWAERTMPEMPPSPWFIQVLDVLSWIVGIVGNGMLFAPGANAWYRAMRASR